MDDFTPNDVLDTLMKNLKDLITTKSIVGDPIQAGASTVVPVMKVSLGFGAGGGMSKVQSGSGGGGGGGISITPVGFLVVHDGKATMITGGKSQWEWVAEALPDIVERFSKMRRDAKRDKEKGSSFDEPDLE